MDEKEVFNPQSGERIAPKKPKKFWKDWRFYVYTIIALMLGIVSVSSMVTACAAINAGVGQSEPVSSQYKVRHNYLITTDNGAYQGYKFAVSTNWTNMMNGPIGTVKADVWSVDPSNYNLSLDSTTTVNIGSNWGAEILVSNWIKDYIVELGRTSYLRLLAVYSNARMGSYEGAYAYFTFIAPTGGVSETQSFRLVEGWAARGLNIYDYGISNSDYINNYFIETNTINSLMMFQQAPDESSLNNIYTFQDTASWYKSQGYAHGYSQGETAGNSAGYSSGYSDGHTAGYAEGYDAGETHAYDTIKTGIAFETYGMYADAKITLVADRTEGSYSYMDLFDYVTDTNIERSVYVLYIQNASNSTWLGYVQDVNASDSSGAIYDIGSFTGASSTTDVVFTALMDRNLWEGAYITSFHGHAEAVNNAFWFTGGSYAATQQIYQDGYGEGYDAGRTDGYDVGYDAGVQVGRTQGLNEAEPESLTNTLVAVFQQPFNQLYRFFNFNVLGLNVLGIVSGLVSVLVVVKVFRKLYK